MLHFQSVVFVAQIGRCIDRRQKNDEENSNVRKIECLTIGRMLKTVAALAIMENTNRVVCLKAIFVLLLCKGESARNRFCLCPNGPVAKCRMQIVDSDAAQMNETFKRFHVNVYYAIDFRSRGESTEAELKLQFRPCLSPPLDSVAFFGLAIEWSEISKLSFAVFNLERSTLAQFYDLLNKARRTAAHTEWLY